MCLEEAIVCWEVLRYRCRGIKTWVWSRQDRKACAQICSYDKQRPAGNAPLRMPARRQCARGISRRGLRILCKRKILLRDIDKRIRRWKWVGFIFNSFRMTCLLVDLDLGSFITGGSRTPSRHPTWPSRGSFHSRSISGVLSYLLSIQENATHVQVVTNSIQETALHERSTLGPTLIVSFGGSMFVVDDSNDLLDTMW
jgi:hypothetical protein